MPQHRRELVEVPPSSAEVETNPDKKTQRKSTTKDLAKKLAKIELNKKISLWI